MRTLLALALAAASLAVTGCSPDCSSVCNVSATCTQQANPNEQVPPSSIQKCTEQCQADTSCTQQQAQAFFNCMDKMQCGSGEGAYIFSCMQNSGCYPGWVVYLP